MMQSREVVTLQLGHYSNFVGTHFWNIQEASRLNDSSQEIQHDVLHYADSKDRFIPRVLAVDLKGSLGRLSVYDTFGLTAHKTCDIQDTPVEHWGGEYMSFRSETQRPSDFYKYLHEEGEAKETKRRNRREKIEEEVSVWSDYLTVGLKPKSIFELPHFKHEIDSLDVWTYGNTVFSDSEQKEELVDRFRHLCEECDGLQGVQCLSDFDTGFGGLTKDFITDIKDNYPKTPILIYGASPHKKFTSQGDSDRRTLNSVLSIYSLCTYGNRLASLFVPMDASCWLPFHYLDLNVDKNFHTSAIMATALDTATLPHRLMKGNVDMFDYAMEVSRDPQTLLASLSMALPFPIRANDTMKEAFEALFKKAPLYAAVWMNNLSYNLPPSSIQPNSEGVVFRGFDPEMSESSCLSLLDDALSNYDCPRQRHVVKQAEFYPRAYPAFFKDFVGPRGEVLPKPELPTFEISMPQPAATDLTGDAALFGTKMFGQLLAQSTPAAIAHQELPLTGSSPCLTHLQVSRQFAEYLRRLEADFKAIDKRTLVHYETGGIAADDWKEVHNSLLSLIDNYDSH